MDAEDHIEYDEFGLFHENAAEYGLRYDRPPVVRRAHVEVEPGRHVSALVWGNGDPELVLLHGGAQNAHTWDTVALASGTPLVAIDLPGHGHSDLPARATGAGSPRLAALDLAVAIRTLAPTAKAVVGMSYGGLTAIALTEVAPDLVRRLVLVDVLPGLKAERARHITEFVRGPATFPSLDDLLARTMEFNPQRSRSSLRRGILHNAIQLDDGSWMWRHARRTDPDSDSDSEDAGHSPDVVHDDLADTLGRVQVPVLLARGMRADSVLRDDDVDRLRQLLPSARVVDFDSAGHSIQGDMPVELAATITRFAGPADPH